jgi:hypothetical protein
LISWSRDPRIIIYANSTICRLVTRVIWPARGASSLRFFSTSAAVCFLVGASPDDLFLCGQERKLQIRINRSKQDKDSSGSRRKEGNSVQSISLSHMDCRKPRLRTRSQEKKKVAAYFTKVQRIFTWSQRNHKF